MDQTEEQLQHKTLKSVFGMHNTQVCQDLLHPGRYIDLIHQILLHLGTNFTLLNIL